MKYVEIVKKLTNFFLNHALISFNTAPTPKNIFLRGAVQKKNSIFVDIIQICFSIIIVRNIFWGVFKEIRA